MSQLRRSDGVIAADVRASLCQDPRLTAADVAVDVEDGRVKLSGVVQLDVQSVIAADCAWRVIGVREVVNDIATGPADLRPDADIATEVFDVVARDSRIDTRAVVIHVAEGVVDLSGAVTTALDRRRLEQRVWQIRGVVSVSNELAVSRSLARDDRVIEQDVLDEIARDATILNAQGVTVSVVGGHVVLRGAVERPADRLAAGADAQFVAGVKSVVNWLTVHPVVDD
jgi:osmotically-inducible protein OsmY